MANVFLINLDPATAVQLSRILAVERHRIQQKPQTIGTYDLMQADIVFVGGGPAKYLPLLRWVRKERPGSPFVVVTRLPATSAWLDALETGATDYCSSPFEARQIRWLMQSVLPGQGSVPLKSGAAG